MAYFSLNAYDADVYINSFAGLMQSGDGVNVDTRFALEAENVETPKGVLQPKARMGILSGSFETRIETLAWLYRRWHSDEATKEVLFAATDGQIYYRIQGSSAWTQLPRPSGVSSYQCNVWSWAAYEINPQGSSASVDVLLMSNAKDGMIMIRGDNFTVSKVNTPKKFGVIERYAERIWGGAIPDDPDMLVYSAPYDPTDWSANPDIPEDGAGDINQPSWDGDSFTALRSFGSQLIAFKKNRVWRILGTDPGEYTFKEQYGGGTPFPGTIAVETERILMVEKDGMSQYDGLAVQPFMRQYIEKLWATVNRDAMDQMSAALFKRKYYLAVPVNGSSINNALIVYNIEDGSFLYYPETYIESFLPTESALYATSSSVPGVVNIVRYDSWALGDADPTPVKWASPWMDFGSKRINKGGFEVYFMPEVRGGPVSFRFTIETEKKKKSKTVTVPSTTFRGKQKRVRFGGAGRRFRLILETLTLPEGALWRITGGIQMIVETDRD